MKKDSAEKDLLYRSKFEIIEPYLYLLPFFLGVAVFTLYPVINVVLMSFQEDYSMLTRSFSGWGIGNYVKTLNDPNFWQAIRNTLHYVLLVVPISLVLSLIIANLLNQKLKGSAVYQSIFFLPMVTSVTAVGLAWKFMFNNRGVINYLLGFLLIALVIAGAFTATAKAIFPDLPVRKILNRHSIKWILIAAVAVWLADLLLGMFWMEYAHYKTLFLGGFTLVSISSVVIWFARREQRHRVKLAAKEAARAAQLEAQADLVYTSLGQTFKVRQRD